MPNSASSLTEHGRDDRLEAVPAQLLQHPAHERELEEDEVALEVGEARARDLGAGLHVDHGAGELEVVLAGLGALAPLAERRVLVGGGRIGEVRQRHRELVELLLEPRDLGLELLDPGADGLHLRDRLARVLAGALGLRDRLGAGVARRARLVALGDERVQAAPASPRRRASVRRSRPCGRASAATAGSGSRLIARRSSIVERLYSVAGQSCAAFEPPTTSFLEYFARNSATFSASSPVMMFCGIGPEEKPPLRMA